MKFTDQTGFTIELEAIPERIISLVPSQSELLWDLGLERKLIGITKFCIHPDKMFESTIRVGGTKNIDIKKIRQLKPDLIIGNKEENNKQQIELLRNEFNVWMSDIFNLNTALEMISEVGSITGKSEQAKEIYLKIKNVFEELKNDEFNNKTVAYFIWKNPFIVAAGNTFIDAMLQSAGFKNIFSSLNRYPEVSENEIHKSNPDFIFLSSEPYPFTNEHTGEFQRICPNAKIVMVDGEMFSWYGSRLIAFPSYLKTIAEIKKIGK